MQGVFIESYDPTIEDSYRKSCEIDERPCTLEILDTAGVEQFTAMRELYIKNAQGFILVYSIADESSLKELLTLRQQIIQIKDNPNVPMVLVANKTDLDSSLHQVTSDIGIRVADSWGRIPFYETSAKYRVNIDQVFTDLVRQIMRRDSAFGSVSLKGHSFTRSIDESNVSHHRHKKHGSNVSSTSIQASINNITPSSSLFRFKQHHSQSKENSGTTGGRPSSRESRRTQYMSPASVVDEEYYLSDQESPKQQDLKFLSPVPATLPHKTSHVQLMHRKVSKAFMASSKSMPALRKQERTRKGSETKNKDCVIC